MYTRRLISVRMATGRKQQKTHHDAGRIIKLNTGIHKLELPGDNAAVFRQSLESRSELHLLLTWNTANNKLWLREVGLKEKST